MTRAPEGTGLAWYRLRVTIGRRWPGYVALALLTGLVGGLALAAVTAARRTDSSYPDLLARTNPADLLVQPQVNGYIPRFEGQLARLPQVRGVTASVTFNAATLTGSGRVKTVLVTGSQLVASPDGLFTRQDRMIITSGRAADPARPDQVVATTQAAAQLGLHVGSHVLVGLFPTSQTGPPVPRARLRLTVVGIGRLGIELVRDDIDNQTTGFLVGSPALIRAYGRCCSSSGFYGLRLAGGSRSDGAAEAAYSRLLVTSPLTSSTGGQLVLFVTAQIEAEAQRAIRPEAIALGVFGIVAGLAALIIGAQAISRQVYAAAEDRQVLRALGAGRAAVVADGLPGLLAAVLAGGLAAAVIAAAVSPLTLFGPVRDVEPGYRLYADWSVLALGPAVLVIALGAAAVSLSYRQAPHRMAAAGQKPGSAVVRAVVAAGLPLSAVAGLRFALEPGRGRTAVPVRSVIAGAVLAVTVGAATLTFGASLSGLIARPALYGWNFSYALYSVDGYGPLPPSWTAPLLRRDPQVAATADVYYGTFQVAGQTVPGLAMPVTAGVTPPSLTGHALRDGHEIVLGPATLAQLHKHVGQVVTVSEGELVPPVRLRIVGTAALPTIGNPLGIHPSMSTGAVIPLAAIPARVLHIYGALSGPNTIFVRLRPGVSPAAGQTALAAIVRRVNADARTPQVLADPQVGFIAQYVTWLQLLPVQRPAEIVNYKAMGAMPVAVAAALAAGAVAALGVTLVTSVRRRRRDLALLKALGCTRRQLAGAVAWQATITAIAGLVIGVPLGIAAGRWLWLAFARQLSAVPDPAVPVLSLAVTAAAALILANLVALEPGWRAARTPAAVLLRAE